VSPGDSRSAGRAGPRRSESGPRRSKPPTRCDPDRFDLRRSASGASQPARSGRRRNRTGTTTPAPRAWLRLACDRSFRVVTGWSPPCSSRRTEQAGRNSHACPGWGFASSRPTPRRPSTASPRSPQGREEQAGAGNGDQSWRPRDRSCLDYHPYHCTRRQRPRQAPVSTAHRTRQYCACPNVGQAQA
jgi:hypothetical protein